MQSTLKNPQLEHHNSNMKKWMLSPYSWKQDKSYPLLIFLNDTSGSPTLQ